METMENKSIIHEQIKISHEDERRSITSIFNGEFTAKQIKLVQIKEDSILGNHYHNYAEIFYMLEGEGEYILKDLNTKETTKIQMKKGDKLRINPRVVHKAKLKKGTVLIEGTEKKYINANINDVKYEL